MGKLIPFAIVLLLAANIVFAETPASRQSAQWFTRQQDIVYGRSYGAALTFDIFRPTGKPNGAALSLWSAADGSRRRNY